MECRKEGPDVNPGPAAYPGRYAPYAATCARRIQVASQGRRAVRCGEDLEGFEGAPVAFAILMRGEKVWFYVGASTVFGDL